MPSIRIGFASDFTLNNSLVGFGTTTADQKLEVAGTLKGDFQITGVTTLTEYSGFVAQQQHINEPSTIGFSTSGIGSFQQYYETETGYIDLGGVHHGDDQKFNTLSEDLVIDDGQILNITNTDMVGVTTIGEYDPHNHSSYVCVGSLEQVSVTDHFSVPNGGTNDRQETPIEGTVRFNDDLNTLEFFNGVEWRQFTYNQGQSGRAALGGGSPSTDANMIQYINIHTTGNSSYFGDLTRFAGSHAGFASATRGISGGGAPGTINIIDYITIASVGNAINFGDLTVGRTDHGGLSSSTRGLFGGGYSPNPSPAKQSVNVIDYVEIATLGNALDFGDLTIKPYTHSGCSSPTRGIFTGGFSYLAPSPAGFRVSEFNSVTIASKGNALDFGDATNDYNGKASCSNSVRGVYAGGNDPSSMSEMGSFIIASFGSFTNFGDLTRKRSTSTGVSTKTRGVFAGGVESFPTRINTIDYITFSSAGNAIDFGELIRASSEPSGMSDSHGGLGGF